MPNKSDSKPPASGKSAKSSTAPPSIDRSSVPWQVDWKNPTWKQYSVPKESTAAAAPASTRRQNDRRETIVGLSTAQVQCSEIANEVPSLWQSLAAATTSATMDSHNEPKDEHGDHWLLTVTLLDPSGESFSGKNTSTECPVASEILLELTHCDTKEILHSRRLVWPETIASATKRRKEAMQRNIWTDLGHTFLPWLKLDPVVDATNDDGASFPSDTGLVAATLCRQPLTKEAKREEALEVISSMMVGLGPSAYVDEKMGEEGRSRLVSSGDKVEIASGQVGDRMDESSTESRNDHPLCLACVSTRGLICIYSVWDLLSLVAPLTEVSNETEPPSKLKEERAMASWLLGAELFQQLESSWLPLSQPKTTISLSILNEASNLLNGDQSTEDESLHHTKTEDEQDEKEPSTPNEAIVGLPSSKPATSLLAWNPWIEASTLPQRTIYNRAMSIYVVGPSFPFLVVLGQGIPHNSPAVSSKARKKNQKSVSRNEARPKTVAEEQSQNDDAKVILHEAPAVASRGAPGPEEDWWRDADKGDSLSNEKKKASRASTQQEEDGSEDASLFKGGFITLCSMASWSESKTFFLDFVPRSVTHVHHWHGMELLLCVGDDRAVAIRLDPFSSTVLVGMDEELKSTLNNDDGNNGHHFSHQPTVSINRFQILPVNLNLPTTSNSRSKMESRVLCGAGTTPPALLQLYTEVDLGSQMEQSLLVMPSFVGVSKTGSILTSAQETGHVAQIPIQEEESNDHSLLRSAWGYLGQGWSLLGTGSRVYFLSWEGATATRGISFVHELSASPIGIHSPVCVSSVIPCPNFTKEAASASLATSIRFDDGVEEKITGEDIHGESNSTDLVTRAMHSISSTGLGTRIPAMGTSDSPKPAGRLGLSHQEKSERLLQHLSSWTQLEDTNDNREWLNRHVPIVAIKSHRNSSTVHGSLNVLRMRQIVIENGAASPFSQVVGWLSQKKDYFTAASIALDLLRDSETLYYLWKHAEMIDEEDEQTKLKGLLDGIMPVNTIEDDGQSTEQSPTSATWTQLADMTVGCLIKGGLSMSKTLMLFLQTNRYYDPARASLMLVAATANTVSGDGGAIDAAMGSPEDPSTCTLEYSVPELLWPMQCLLKIGVARDCLKMILNLVNGTIPDELRRRPRQGGEMTLPSLDLTKAIVTMIVSCDPVGARLLLDLQSEQTDCTFWESLDSQTQQALALIEIHHKYPMLIQDECREWVRLQLHNSLKGGGHCEGASISVEWLRELATACLFNAGCDLQDFVLDPTNLSMMSIGSENSTVWADLEMDGEDGLFQHKLEIVETRNALEPSLNSGGLDFDVLISCLLLLQSHQAAWRERSEKFVSTQALLDAACYLAGRPTARSEEPRFRLDAKTLMEECALSGNVRAGANLIGGKNGFILSCCNILMLELQVSMEEAEAFFLSERLNSERIITEESSKFQQHRFELTESHRQLLWLLDDYVLSVRTYGEFESTHYSRGRVDPVFAARSIFRAWLCLTYFCRRTGSDWICRWLTGRLGLQRDATGRHRLACAAMVRALLWPSDGHEFSEDSMPPDSLLGHVLKMEEHFLLQLAQSSCGLVESVPPPIADGLIGLVDATQELSTGLASIRLNRM